MLVRSHETEIQQSGHGGKYSWGNIFYLKDNFGSVCSAEKWDGNMHLGEGGNCKFMSNDVVQLQIQFSETSCSDDAMKI